MLLIIALSLLIQLANCSMCQHHQAALEARSQQQAALTGQTPASLNPINNQATNQANQVNQGLIVCPKSSQFNNLPQFPPKYVNPNLERQQREILKHLNASFANHLQLHSADAPADEQPLIDDELLNEIISPLVVDAAYERAKELIVKRRKLESELIRQGESN